MTRIIQNQPTPREWLINKYISSQFPLVTTVERTFFPEACLLWQHLHTGQFFLSYKTEPYSILIPKTNQLLYGDCWQHYLSSQEVLWYLLKTEFCGEKSYTSAFKFQVDASKNVHEYGIFFTLTGIYYILQVKKKVFTTSNIATNDHKLYKNSWKSCSKFCSFD